METPLKTRPEVKARQETRRTRKRVPPPTSLREKVTPACWHFLFDNINNSIIMNNHHHHHSSSIIIIIMLVALWRNGRCKSPFLSRETAKAQWKTPRNAQNLKDNLFYDILFVMFAMFYQECLIFIQETTKNDIWIIMSQDLSRRLSNQD